MPEHTTDGERDRTVTVFVCGGCLGLSEHVWDGPDYVSEDGLMVSATCSKCGIAHIDWSMMNAP